MTRFATEDDQRYNGTRLGRFPLLSKRAFNPGKLNVSLLPVNEGIVSLE